ncbi:predicted signal transduction protein containing a membrane domain, an EAL and a GGDEF domain [Alteromonadales bacterium TW-7]|uniref:EAL domain-containing protein n=2 Tax=Pseudoalteromonas TaxID=53246 RepID=UPI0000EA9E1B|nr:EAL domain-containing protein [Pseudoalteromonas sp. 2CM32C]EAW27009.1 predicted signal transduction protein containing a membrane domain, an EAL and a GGDEF domain [Alteromonadales bacterium TW-7]MCK8123042.1 EAL domain-containing protein [Pseudoalteromonas sp. 2CM32C]
MHKLLARQLKRSKVDESFVQEYTDIISRVSDAYELNEREINILERSLFITSNELNERNDLLKNQLNELSDTQQQLEHSISVLNATFDAIGEQVTVLDLKGNVVSANIMAREFFERFNLDAYNYFSQIDKVIKKGNKSADIIAQLKADSKQALSGEFESIDDKHYSYRSLPQLKNGQLIGRVFCIRDISVEKEHEEIIHFQAYHDALTGLANRQLFMDRLEHSLTLARRDDSMTAVLFLDLDNFKRVNDTEGHKGGDELLIKMVERINHRLREQDTLARIGGDEFVILVELVKSKNNIENLCEALLETISKEFIINGRPQYVSSSIGIALYPQDGITPDSLLSNADMAMYDAKNNGKNAYRFYHRKLEAHAREQMDIERELRKAINNQELEIYLQPKIGLDCNQILGAEVLMRWFTASGESIPPDLFIPIAESTGLIKKIGEFAISSAISLLEQWQLEGIAPLKLAVNLSIIEFQDEHFIDYIIESISNSSISGDQLIIELTESIFMENKEKMSKTMHKLKHYGVAFALDDFGKGYSSFSYLQLLPIDYLKIDKSFLQNVITDEQSAAIAKCIIDIGHNLDLAIIAEGIEDQETLDYVSKTHCEMAQGFFMYRPMPSDSFTKLIRKNSHAK